MGNVQYNVHKEGGLVFLGAEPDSTSFHITGYTMVFSTVLSAVCTIRSIMWQRRQKEFLKSYIVLITVYSIFYITVYSRMYKKCNSLVIFNFVLEAERQVYLSDFASSKSFFECTVLCLLYSIVHRSVCSILFSLI